MLIGETIQLSEVLSTWRILGIQLLYNHRVMIQYLTTTIFEELLLFLKAKYFRYRLIHLLGVLKPLSLGLL